MSVKEGVYWIRNLQWTNKVLDLSGGDLAQGASVLNFDENDTFNKPLNQLWLVERFDSRNKYIIRNVHSNLVLDLSEGSSANGTPIFCWNQHGRTNQQWQIEWFKDVHGTAYYHIINVATGTAVSHNQDDSIDTTVGWSVDGGRKQLWSFIPFTYPLTYRLRVKSTGRVLDLSDASSTNGTPALAFEKHTVPMQRNQLWRLQNGSSSGEYTIQCLETGTAADLEGGNADNGTAICGWQPHGGRNQQWKMHTLADDSQKITNVLAGSVMDAFVDDDDKRVGGWQYNGGNNQRWFLDTVPSPSPGWVLIQNGGTGKFLCSDPLGNISTTDGPETVFDESVQWRFLQKNYTGVYTLVNRATGRFLRQLSSRPSISLVETTHNAIRDWWLLEAYNYSDAGLVSIISRETGNTLDHYAAERIEALDNRTDDSNRSWKIMPANDWLTSFTLINGKTGLCLSAHYRREEIRLSTVDDLNKFHAQWIFRKVAEGPLFSIQNKANNYIMGGPSALWELVVCCDKYFGVRNNTTGKYLAIKDGQPTFEDADMNDQHQCWELASGRIIDDDYDLIYMDDDVLRVLESFLNSQQRDDMKHRIRKRGAKKPPKDKSEWKLPSKGRITEPDNQTVRQLLNALIDRWEWDVVNEEQQPVQTLISFGQAEAESVIGQRLPQSIRRIYASSRQPNTVFRLDRQGYINVAGGRYVNLQGQYGTDTYFHITLPVGVRYGREEIRRFMRESLDRSTTIVITPTTCKPPDGGPPYRRDPGSGGGNSWIKWAIALLATSIVEHSEL